MYGIEHMRHLAAPENKPMIIDVTDAELDLMIEALKARATRHDSLARVNNNMIVANQHEQIAIAMRKLARRLTLAIKELA